MSESANFVFLHGGGQGGWVWDETIAALKAKAGNGVRCHALDGPGCGSKRQRDVAGMSFDEINRELVADVIASGMRDIVLVGHSQAGLHLPAMAEQRPDLFRKLIFVTCIAPAPGKSSMDTLGGGMHGENPDEIGWPVDPRTTTIPERLGAMFCNDMDEGEAEAFLARLGKDEWPESALAHNKWRRDHLANVPSTYVLCLRDKALTPEWQRRFAELLHADTVVEIDAGHQVMNTRPEELAEVLLAQSGR